jgi:hypothetical protein
MFGTRAIRIRKYRSTVGSCDRPGWRTYARAPTVVPLAAAGVSACNGLRFHHRGARRHFAYKTPVDTVYATGPIPLPNPARVARARSFHTPRNGRTAGPTSTWGRLCEQWSPIPRLDRWVRATHESLSARQPVDRRPRGCAASVDRIEPLSHLRTSDRAISASSERLCVVRSVIAGRNSKTSSTVLVPEPRFELGFPFGRPILSRLRLPVPPLRPAEAYPRRGYPRRARNARKSGISASALPLAGRLPGRSPSGRSPGSRRASTAKPYSASPLT